jgi:hypothetical protein
MVDCHWRADIFSGDRTLIAAPRRDALQQEKSAMAGAPSPAREEARALPGFRRDVNITCFNNAGATDSNHDCLKQSNNRRGTVRY